jgi:phosphatidylglycerophosphatase A
MNRIAKTIILFIAQGAYSGRSPFAPGTAGTVVGVLLYLFVKGLWPAWYPAAAAAVIVIGIWTADRAEVLLGRKDAPSIVIDEIAGYLVAMFLVPFGWGFITAGFFLFRFFDIVKPWPLRRLEDLHGGFGVMLDDVGAGIYTNVVLQVVWRSLGSG